MPEQPPPADQTIAHAASTPGQSRHDHRPARRPRSHRLRLVARLSPRRLHATPPTDQTAVTFHRPGGVIVDGSSSIRRTVAPESEAGPSTILFRRLPPALTPWTNRSPVPPPLDGR